MKELVGQRGARSGMQKLVIKEVPSYHYITKWEELVTWCFFNHQQRESKPRLRNTKLHLF